MEKLIALFITFMWIIVKNNNFWTDLYLTKESNLRVVRHNNIRYSMIFDTNVSLELELTFGLIHCIAFT